MEKYNDLTNKQKEILIYIKKFIADNKYPPSIREICKAINLKSPATVHVHINNLISRGYIKRSNNSNRALELLTPNEFESSNVTNVPFLSKVNTQKPLEAIENCNEYFSLPSDLIPKAKEVFTLRANGESMINAGILDKDIVIIERKNTAKNGDIIATIINDNEITLRTFYKEKNYIRLQPENDFMTPTILKKATILGKVIGLYRKF